MLSTEEILERAAKDGSIESAEWMRSLDTVLEILERNIHTAFPTPKEPPRPAVRSPDPPSSPPKPQTSDQLNSDTPSQAANKENAPPSSPPSPSPTLPRSTRTPPSDDAHTSTPSLPIALAQTHAHITRTLTTTFPTAPPHTIQRLSELLLHPTAHHFTLPSYLTALTRVLSVSSPSTLFPLPISEPAVPGANSVLIHGAAPAPRAESEREKDEENLGGALLSPIPWLHRNGAATPAMETTAAEGSPPGTALGYERAQGQDTAATRNGPVSDDVPQADRDMDADADRDADMSDDPSAQSTPRDAGAITQGELLRREQEDSEPAVPLAMGPSAPSHAQSQTAPAQTHPPAQPQTPTPAARDAPFGEAGQAEQRPEPEHPLPDSDAPHARGPERIGMEDTGPQGTGGAGSVGVGQVLDMSAAVGRGGERGGEGKDGDGDVDMDAVGGGAEGSEGDGRGEGEAVAVAPEGGVEEGVGGGREGG